MTAFPRTTVQINKIRFLGDLFLDHPESLNVIGSYSAKGSLPTILNLEGAFAGELKRRKQFVLTHDPDTVWKALAQLDVIAVSLCNNHVFDRGNLAFEQMIRELDKRGINRFGAGSTLAEALEPWKLTRPDQEPLLFLGHGCAHEMCPPASLRSAGVAPLNEDLILSQIKHWRDQGRIILQLHWGHEYEEWPLPLHRGMAHRFIKAGAAAIIGHHAHIIQHYEFVSGAPVFYGLGNFHFSSLGPMFRRMLGERTWGLEVHLDLESMSTKAFINDIFTLERVSIPINKWDMTNVPTGDPYEKFFDSNRTSSHKPRLADGQPFRNFVKWEKFRLLRLLRKFATTISSILRHQW